MRLWVAIVVIWSAGVCRVWGVGDPEPVKKAAAPPSEPAVRAETGDKRLEVQAAFPAAREQALMARSGFSPGLIDNKPGRKTRVAVEQFQAAHGLEVTGTVDGPTLEALGQGDPLAKGTAWVSVYRVTSDDLALVTGPIPEDWNERAALEVSGYADLEELLAERGWCSVELLRGLNPGVEINAIEMGGEVVIPDVRGRALPKVAKLQIRLEEKMVLGFDEAGVQTVLLHCSVAKMVEKRPVGELKVKVIATEPDYTFDPKDWPEVENVTTKLRIAPGPRNPVGAAWIGLDRPGYGMHGTVRPQDIGKTGSHGCFRLSNWDASRLARSVKVGTVVEVVE